MWRTNEKAEVLIDSCQKVSAPKKEDQKEVVADQNETNLELNSGVKFPGESIEPLIGAATNLEDDTFDEGVLVIEYKLNKASDFAFQFIKDQRVIIGKCEFCN